MEGTTRRLPWRSRTSRPGGDHPFGQRSSMRRDPVVNKERDDGSTMREGVQEEILNVEGQNTSMV
jgi:hypothetical protein